MRNGRGPKKGAPNAGRPAKHVRMRMEFRREQAIEQIGDRMDKDELKTEELLRVVKEWAPPGEQLPDAVGWILPVPPKMNLEDWSKQFGRPA